MATALGLVLATLGLAIPAAAPARIYRLTRPAYTLEDVPPMDPWRGATKDRSLRGKDRRRARQGDR